MRFTRRSLARLAVAVVWVFAAQLVTTAGGELVRITAPKDGQAVKGRIRVQAETKAENAAYLIFCIDGARPHSTNCQPYQLDVDTAALSDGPHSLAVEVYGRQGLLERSAPVTVQVTNGNPPEPPAVAKVAAPSSPASKRVTAIPPRVTAPQVAVAPPDAIAKPASAQDGIASMAREPAASLPEGRTSSAQPASAQAFSPVLILRREAISAPVSERDPMRRADASSSHKERAEVAACGHALVVVLDGRQLSFDVAPAVLGGRAFGGLRTLIERSGGKVDWVGAAKQAIARHESARLEVTVGVTIARLDGRAIQLGAAPMLAKGRTIVPLRTTCEPLGYRVAWTADSRTVRLVSAGAPMHVGMRAAH